MKQKILCLIVGVSCSVLLNNTNAQSKISIRCQFDTGNSAEYVGQDIRQKRQATGDLPPLTYDQINARENSARLITGTGTNDVYVMTGAIGSVHLMESTGYGNLNITTVFNISQITFKNSVPAVHSRHNASPRGNSTNPIPSQYYGSCLALP
jgi:hypothetical protein